MGIYQKNRNFVSARNANEEIEVKIKELKTNIQIDKMANTEAYDSNGARNFWLVSIDML